MPVLLLIIIEDYECLLCLSVVFRYVFCKKGKGTLVNYYVHRAVILAQKIGRVREYFKNTHLSTRKNYGYVHLTP